MLGSSKVNVDGTHAALLPKDRTPTVWLCKLNISASVELSKMMSHVYQLCEL